MRRLGLHPDRALPADPDTREIARTIYTRTRSLPLLCMHGHVEASVLAENRPFTDPASLMVTPDHYVTRMLASQGVPLEALGVRRHDDGWVEQDPREIWRTFCGHWHLFRATPSRFWLEHELVELFDVRVVPSEDSADAIYDQIASRLAEPGYLPRALLERFGIEILATTDSALSTLDSHAAMHAGGWSAQVIPTFRPDALVHLAHAAWPEAVAQLSELTGVDTSSYLGYLDALRVRRAAFCAAGARADAHGYPTS